MSAPELNDFESSALGKKEYWDAFYQQELANLETHGDEGEIWFGKHCEGRIVKWMAENIERKKSILEVGCGNGHLLVCLYKLGFASLTGMDYSEQAISMSLKLAEKKSCPEEAIKFFRGDLFDKDLSKFSGRYDFIIDKGTFDAICLSELNSKKHKDSPSTKASRSSQVKELATIYASAITTMLAEKTSYFLITSCNWTADELRELLAPQLVPASPETHVPFVHPDFTFGGVKGHVVTTLVFQPICP